MPESMAVIALACAAAFVGSALAANPLVANVGQADPHIHYWAEAVPPYWAYATHDASNKNTGFTMHDWWVWSSPDLRTWTLASILYPNATPAPVSAYSSCWATDGAHKKNAVTGAWEYYFCERRGRGA